MCEYKKIIILKIKRKKLKTNLKMTMKKVSRVDKNIRQCGINK